MILFEPHFSGVSGDMLLASLVSLGADAERLKRFERFSGLGVHKIAINPLVVCPSGIKGIRLDIAIEEEPQARNYEELKTLLKAAAEAVGASRSAVEKADRAIRLLVEAEADVHGEKVETVHLHEAGSFDTILDCLGFFVLLESLDDARPILSTFVSTGSGSIHCAHGILPVPVPAVLEIARRGKVPLKEGPVEGELATPTGVALLASSASFVMEGVSSYTPHSIGYGVGTRSFGEHRPNFLRAVLCHGKKPEELFIIEAGIDDMTGEEVGRAVASLQKIVPEVACIPGTGKKGRPFFLFRAIAESEQLEPVLRFFLKRTSTLGVRYWPVARIKMERRIEKRTVVFDGEEIPLRVKISTLGDIRKTKPESDDIASLERSD